MQPELFRPVPLDRADGSVTIEAKDGERAAIANRLGLPEIFELRCEYRLVRDNARIAVQGKLHSRLTQICVVTLEPFEAVVTETFSAVFVPETELGEVVDPAAEDEIPYAGRQIDLGEATVQQLALLLDPYPRKPGASLPDPEPDPAKNPFSVLAFRRPTS